MKPVAEMTNAELQEARERLDDEVRSLNGALRNVNDEIWLREFNKDTARLQKQEPSTDG